MSGLQQRGCLRKHVRLVLSIAVGARLGRRVVEQGMYPVCQVQTQVDDEERGWTRPIVVDVSGVKQPGLARGAVATKEEPDNRVQYRSGTVR